MVAPVPTLFAQTEMEFSVPAAHPVIGHRTRIELNVERSDSTQPCIVLGTRCRAARELVRQRLLRRGVQGDQVSLFDARHLAWHDSPSAIRSLLFLRIDLQPTGQGCRLKRTTRRPCRHVLEIQRTVPKIPHRIPPLPIDELHATETDDLDDVAQHSLDAGAGNRQLAARSSKRFDDSIALVLSASVTRPDAQWRLRLEFDFDEAVDAVGERDVVGDRVAFFVVEKNDLAAERNEVVGRVDFRIRHLRRCVHDWFPSLSSLPLVGAPKPTNRQRVGDKTSLPKPSSTSSHATS